ncbi:MAG: hypothetical protein LC679_10910 [Intrasporangiaceae bacterium]|nr:hypothetical protein [Intrasporangiaceae bacterium]
MALGGATLLGFRAASVLSSRYLADISDSLVPLLVGGAAAGAATVGLAFVVRRQGLVGPSWLPNAVGAVVVLVGIVLATRPLWLVVRRSPDDPVSRVVAGLQLRQGLPVDGGRTYAERTVEWLSWWVGPIALGVALLVLAAAVAVLVRGRQAGRLPAWTGVLLVAAGSSALTLWRPGITPDHPWAERRLLIAICLAAVLVVAGAAWFLRQPWPPWTRWGSAGVALAALLVPTAVATWPHTLHRVEAGSVAAVEEACSGFEPGDVALMVDARAANEWPQVLRGQCGVPALSTTARLRDDPTALAKAVEQVSDHVETNGGRLVLVAAEGPEVITSLTGTEPDLLVDRTVLEDARLLEERPESLVPLRLALWSAAPNA